MMPEQLLHDGLRSRIYLCREDAVLPDSGPDHDREHDEEHDREHDVGLRVLKLLNAEVPTAAQLAALSNEYLRTRALPEGLARRALSQIQWQGRPALVLEYVPGVTLATYFSTTRPRATLLKVALGLAEALDGLHRLGLVHRDINPQNALVDPQTLQLRLIDFGLAVDLRAGAPPGLAGTLAYLAPEQTGRTHHSVDGRSDLYALGVSLYELLTASLPFSAEDSLGLVHAHLALPPEPPLARLARPDEVDQALSGIILKLMAKDQDDRYQSAAGLIPDLRLCLEALAEPERLAGFRPGQSDRSQGFRLSRRLYGREAEITALLAAVERRSESGARPELLLLAGPSGVGKTFLVDQIHKPLLARRGRYGFGGKYDQLQRQIPYAAFIQGMSDLVRGLLTESPERLAVHQARLQSALGANAGALTDVIPALNPLLGAVPPLAPLEPLESQLRFNHTFGQLIQVLLAPGQPLVLFIDDLQWADAASLKLLTSLLQNPALGGLLLIGAYRDNETGPEHPLRQLLESPEGLAVSQLVIQALDPNSVAALIADSLGCSLADCQELTRLVCEKTRGNAFFIHQFLSTLHQQGLLSFDTVTGGWVWEIARIRSQNVTDNVVTLMSEQVRRLPETTQTSLKRAACIGNRFGLDVLALVCRLSPEQTHESLLPAFELGLLLPGPEPVQLQFLHDRVQQAAYALIDPEQRPSLHLDIGRLLARQQAFQSGDGLFALLHHLNLGRELIREPAERHELARLNFEAARRAHRASAPEAVAEFCAVGISLLPWQQDPELAFELHLLAA